MGSIPEQGQLVEVRRQRPDADSGRPRLLRQWVENPIECQGDILNRLVTSEDYVSGT